MSRRKKDNANPERINEMVSELRAELEKSGLDHRMNEEIIRLLTVSAICGEGMQFPVREPARTALVEKISHAATVSLDEAENMLKEYERFNAERGGMALH
jgi:hypothetical protein